VSIPGKYTVQSPLMMKSPSGLYVIFEAAVVNYPVMHLNVDVKNLKAQLVPNAIGDKAYLQTCIPLENNYGE
jgi:hypothetical protein